MNDGLDLSMISPDPNFAFRLSDPSGKLTSTGNPPGFIDNTLTSRGFVIKPNVTASPSPSALVSAFSTLSTSSSSPTSSVPSTSTTTKTAASASTTSTLHSGPSRPIVAGLAAGLSSASVLALLAFLLLYSRRRLAKKVLAENADRLVRAEGPAGVNSMRPALHAGSTVPTPDGELSGFPPVHLLRPELGDSRFSRQELSAEQFSRLELSAEQFSRQELSAERLSRQELSAERFPRQELGNVEPEVWRRRFS